MSTDNSNIFNSSIENLTKSNDNLSSNSSNNILSENTPIIDNTKNESEILLTNNKPFYKLNMLDIVLELKNTWFSILDDILLGKLSLDIIFKENRLFYVGLTILIIAIILYIYDYAINPNNFNNNGIVEIRHVYETKN
jgi:hypothetical protein